MPRRLAVISMHAHHPFTPRGERTRRLVARLERDWDVELIAPPSHAQGATPASRSKSPARALAVAALNGVWLDRFEPYSVRRLRRWMPRVDAALMIAWPFSAPVYAARRLAGASIPYVVDAGDPWVLTASECPSTHLALGRARRAERELWRNASGAVLTTDSQAQALERLFPQLAILVRPNGYPPLPAGGASRARGGTEGVLRLAHFGMLSTARLDLRPLLEALAASGLWRSIVFAQFGDDYVGALDSVPAGVTVERHPSYPWEEVVERADNYDLAVVVGNVNPRQLPSKAVQYLTLRVPRLALTEGSPDDALAGYVRELPGWLALAPSDPDAPARIRDHLARGWTVEDLRAPQSEGWPGVADTVAGFLERCVGERAQAAP
jgi:hypothetical protein